MKQLRGITAWAILVMAVQAMVWAEPPAKVAKQTIPLGSIRERIPCEFFQPDFPNGDSNYHSLVSASDGKLYFSIDTHNTDFACRFYAFDPKADTMKLIAEMDAPLGEDARKEISQGKVHVPFFEHKGKLYFATHTLPSTRTAFPAMTLVKNPCTRAAISCPTTCRPLRLMT